MRIPALLCALVLAVAGCKKSDSPVRTGSGSSSSETLSDDSPVVLKVKWPQGSRYTQRMEMMGNSEAQMPQSARAMQQNVELNQEYSITVVGPRQLELEFQSTEINVTMNGKPVLNVDTEAEASGTEASNSKVAPLAASFRQAIGGRIKFLLNESNYVEKVEGFKEFVAKASAGGDPQSRAMIGSMFSEDQLQQMVDFQRGLPAQPVKPGDSWPLQTDLKVPFMGPVKMDVNYTFTGWEQRERRKCAAIDFAGTMSSSQGASNEGPGGVTMKLESGKVSGKTWFDPNLGNPVETLINQDMIMHMNVPAFRPGPTGKPERSGFQTSTNRSKQRIVIKLTDVVSAAR